MTDTRVVNLKREPFDVRIDRQGPYGNRHVLGRDGNRPTVIEKHMSDWRAMLDHPTTRTQALFVLQYMKGKRLGCHCAPAPCHGDNYVRLIAEYCS